MSYKRNILSFAFVASAAVVAMAPAQASNFNLGTIPSGTQVSSPLVSHPKSSTPFSDTFAFTILGSGAGSAGYVNFTLNLAKYNIVGASFALAGPVSLAAQSIASSVPISINFAPGSYIATLKGKATGQLGGQYYLGIAAPTPEPEAWASILLGLSLAGFLARRRKRLTSPSPALAMA
jgi:opacity protein-like surface antigen